MGQGIYSGGIDDGYDSITLEWASTNRDAARENRVLRTVWQAGERVEYPLRETAVLLDAAGKTAAVFRPGPNFVIPHDLPEGVYFFVYMGRGQRAEVRNGREK